MHGVIVSINVSSRKGERKRGIDAAIVTESGIKGDAHEGGERQISILAEESILKLKKEGIDVGYGDFAENLTIRGIETKKIKVGQKIIIGKNVVLEVTHIGKKCHRGVRHKKNNRRLHNAKRRNFCKSIERRSNKSWRWH